MGLKPRVTRIVVAAGAGSRMGRTKPLLRLGDRTALAHIAGLAMTGLDADTVVVTGHDHHAVAEEATRLGCRVAENRDWRRGQTSSVQAGLSAIAPDAVAVILHPADLPLVKQSDYDAVLRAWLAAPDRARAIVATSFDRRRGHPVMIPRTLVAAILALGPDDPVRDVIRRHAADVHHVVVDHRWVVADLDHPEDLIAAEEEWRRRFDSAT